MRHLLATDDPYRCSVCRDEIHECRWEGDHPSCPDCHQPIMGARWNAGRCLECHEDALLPPGSWYLA